MFASRAQFRLTLLFLCLFISLSIPLLWYTLGSGTTSQVTYPEDNYNEFTSPNNASAAQTKAEDKRALMETATYQPSVSSLLYDNEERDEVAVEDQQHFIENLTSDKAALTLADDDVMIQHQRQREDNETVQLTVGEKKANHKREQVGRSFDERTLIERFDIKDKERVVNQIIYKCSPDPQNHVRIPEAGTYQPVVNNMTWLLSAHVDHRMPGALLIRVLGLSTEISDFTTKPHRHLYCQLWNNDGRLVAIALTKMEKLYLFGFRIESFQMECIFKGDLYRQENSVLSLTTDACDEPNNAVKITDSQRPERPVVNYTVCICGPIKYNYSDYQRLIEWMELNTLLGAGRTIIYNVNASQLVNHIFDYYKRSGVLEVYNVNPPYVYGDHRWIIEKNEDPAYAKMSMRHDCLMREMFKTKYVAFMDLDETIAPRLSTDFTWDDMILSAGCRDNEYILACNVHFRRNWGVDYMVKKVPEISVTYRLLTLMTTYRDDMFFLPLVRSKYFVKPEQVVAASTHRAFMIHGKLPCVLPSDVGALHHYKYRSGGIKDIVPIRDRTMFKYRELLLARVSAVYRELRKDLELFDIFV